MDVGRSVGTLTNGSSFLSDTPLNIFVDLCEYVTQGLTFNVDCSMGVLPFVIDYASFDEDKLPLIKLLIWLSRLHKLGRIGPPEGQKVLVSTASK